MEENRNKKEYNEKYICCFFYDVRSQNGKNV